MKLYYIITISLFLGINNNSFASDCTFFGGNWDSPLSWSCGHVPTINDNVFIDNKTGTLQSDVTINDITFTGSGNIIESLGGPFTITIKGDMDISDVDLRCLVIAEGELSIGDLIIREDFTYKGNPFMGIHTVEVIGHLILKNAATFNFHPVVTSIDFLLHSDNQDGICTISSVNCEAEIEIDQFCKFSNKGLFKIEGTFETFASLSGSGGCNHDFLRIISGEGEFINEQEGDISLTMNIEKPGFVQRNYPFYLDVIFTNDGSITVNPSGTLGFIPKVVFNQSNVQNGTLTSDNAFEFRNGTVNTNATFNCNRVDFSNTVINQNPNVPRLVFFNCTSGAEIYWNVNANVNSLETENFNYEILGSGSLTVVDSMECGGDAIINIPITVLDTAKLNFDVDYDQFGDPFFVDAYLTINNDFINYGTTEAHEKARIEILSNQQFDNYGRLETSRIGTFLYGDGTFNNYGVFEHKESTSEIEISTDFNNQGILRQSSFGTIVIEEAFAHPQIRVKRNNQEKNQGQS